MGWYGLVSSGSGQRPDPVSEMLFSSYTEFRTIDKVHERSDEELWAS
jgi:hypothetical protein